MTLIKFALAMTIALTGCSQKAPHTKSLDLSKLTDSIAPGEDFYLHVNKAWMEEHPLTGEYARFGNFDLLRDTAQEQVRRLVLEVAESNPAEGSVAYKVATIYNLAMDSVRRNAEGASPIAAHLAKIENAPADSMTAIFNWLQAGYASPFVNAGPMEDMMDSNNYAMYVSTSSLGMGDRDYYLKDDPRNTEVREAYKALIVAQMQNAGYSAEDAARIMQNVMKLETSMAEKALTREESRDITKMYNPMSLEQLQQTYPQIDWKAYFPETMMGIEAPAQIIVTEVEPLKRNMSLLGSATDRELKDYYLWKYVMNAAPYLSDDFTLASFEFNKVMSGVTELRPRWKRALGATEGTLGEAIGELYVAKYFPASSKEYMVNLVEDLREALGQHIDSLTWMSDSTKVNAHKKLAKFTVKIGYPDKWKDYSTMEIDPKLSYYENMHNASMWHVADLLSKWGKPVDKSEWGMTPQTVNAYYNPMANEIVFPAAILQAPFFDPEATDAENYGGIGVVIGHEMTHGFDDQGRNFDADGNMVNWWTDADAAAFQTLTEGLVAQFDSVEVLPGLHANGRYTLGENIADQGGLRVAMTAFLNSQKKKGVDVTTQLINGFTPAQIFYMNYANLWAQNIRDEEIRSLTIGDVHSLGNLRVNVSLRNLEPFFEAFGIKEGDKMWRPESERVIIW